MPPRSELQSVFLFLNSWRRNVLINLLHSCLIITGRGAELWFILFFCRFAVFSDCHENGFHRWRNERITSVSKADYDLINSFIFLFIYRNFYQFQGPRKYVKGVRLVFREGQNNPCFLCSTNQPVTPFLKVTLKQSLFVVFMKFKP